MDVELAEIRKNKNEKKPLYADEHSAASTQDWLATPTIRGIRWLVLCRHHLHL